MNLINYIEHISLKDKIYCFFVSELTKDDNNLICEYDSKDLYEDFGEGSDEVLSELVDSGLVIVKKDHIILGTCVGRSYKLFSANEASPDAEYEAIIKRAEEFAELSGLGNVVKYELETLISKKNLTVPEFVKFFRACYEAEYQSQHREFFGKEVGQLKNLLRVYSEVALKRIIIYYCLNSEKYKTTNVSGLCYNADSINQILITKGTKSRRRSRAGKTHNDDSSGGF